MSAGSPGAAAPVFSARPYESGQQARWDDLVARSRNGTFLLKRGYLEYHADRFVDASLTVWRGKKLVGVFPASRHGDEVVSHGGLTYGGLLLDPKTSGRGTLGAFAAVCLALRGAGASTLRVKPVPPIYHRMPAEDELYAIHRLGGALIRRDLASALRPARPGPRSKGRAAMVKAAARRGNIAVRESDDFAAFMAMEASLLADKYDVAPTHTAAELALLVERFPKNIRLFIATVDGELAAGTVIYATAQAAHAQYIASTPEGRACGALDTLHQHVIFTEFADKPWFDFGISTEEQGWVLNEGLCSSKESWGARGVVYDQYRLDLSDARIDAVAGGLR